MEPEITDGASDTVSTDGATACSPEAGTATIRLFHGTDSETALWIAEHGVSWAQMVAYCERYSNSGTIIAPDFFWTTTRPNIAWDYASLNAAVQKAKATPAVFSFTLPMAMVETLRSNTPPLVVQYSREDADYYFLRESFTAINDAMAGQTVTLVADLQLDE